jgi:cysteine desulfurase
MRNYFDHNATSPLRPAVKAAMLAAMDVHGNPSSIHGEGRNARKLLDHARETLARNLGCLPQMIVFTSGGTEANNMALRCIGAERLLVSAIEHPSVLAAANATGKQVDLIPVDGQGRIDLDKLAGMAHGPNLLISVMLANNETGVIQDMGAVSAIARKAGALLHVDAVQAFNKIPVNFGILACDLLTVAAHKVGGPAGVGALVVRDGLAIDMFMAGGGQELRRRAGTENVAGIAGFAAIANEAPVETGELTDQLVAGLGEVVVFSDKVARLSNTTCFAFPGFKAETLLMLMDLEGIAVSSGSACSSGKVGKSHVLDAMSVAPEILNAAIRVSLGWDTTEADVARFIDVWNKILTRHKQRKAA